MFGDEKAEIQITHSLLRFLHAWYDTFSLCALRSSGSILPFFNLPCLPQQNESLQQLFDAIHAGALE